MCRCRQDAKRSPLKSAVGRAPSEIDVAPADLCGAPGERVSASQLATERGVRLDMGEADLVRLLGPASNMGAVRRATLVFLSRPHPAPSKRNIHQR